MLPIRRLSTEEISEAVALYLHLRNHEEVMDENNPKQHQPMCKLCDLTAKEILDKKLYDKIIERKEVKCRLCGGVLSH